MKNSKTRKKKSFREIKKVYPPKAQKINFMEWNNHIFVSSIKKIDLNIILIVILDFLFYLLSGYLVVSWLQRIQAKMAAFNLPTDVVSLGYEKAQQLVGEVKSFYLLIIFSFILLLLAIIFLASILKGIIWAKTAKTKITFKLISKFLGLNLIWMGFWFLVVFLISLLVQPASAPIFMVITITLGLYFTNTLYTIFMKEQKLKTIISAIKLNIKKIHLFLLPYAIIGLLFFVVVKLNTLFKFSYSNVLFSLMLLVYAALVRYYISALVLKIAQ